MTQVFISYSRRDLAFVEQLAADLQAAGLDVWYDLSRLEAGDSWPEEIQLSIDASDIFIIVISPDSIVSRWVRKEFLYASSSNKKVIPLFHRKCNLPLWLLDIHFIDIQGKNYELNFGEILRTLGVKPTVPKKPPVPAIADPIPIKPEKKVGTLKPKKVRAGRRWDSKEIIIFIVFIALIPALLFGLPPLLKQPENTPEPTLTLATAVTKISSPTETIKGTEEPSAIPEPSATSTKMPTPALTSLPTEITDDFGVEMVLVPAGEFTMGKDNDGDIAKSAHMVFLDAFYIDKYEVTNNQYEQCVNDGECSQPTQKDSHTYTDYFGNPEFDEYPVINVNWSMAIDFCKWRGTNLPSEAQWEKAARGTDKRKYPWGNEFSCDAEVTNCTDDVIRVGNSEKGKSFYGAYDMGGNVLEWILDLYSKTYYQNSPKNNPSGPNSGEYRIIRGSWYMSPDITAYDRFWDVPERASNNLGFRCAKDATP